MVRFLTPSRTFSGTNLAGAAEANAELRARYHSAPDSLSDAELERVVQLLKRDARKSQRREQLRTAKAQAAKLFGTEGTHRRAGDTGGASARDEYSQTITNKKQPQKPAGMVLSTIRGHAPTLSTLSTGKRGSTV